jgi:hypothetical protein
MSRIQKSAELCANATPVAEAHVEGRWLIVQCCPFCGERHYHSMGLARDPQHGAFGRIADSDNLGRNRADRKYLLLEASPLRERAHTLMRSVLRSQWGLTDSEIDVAMNCGLEALLW